MQIHLRSTFAALGIGVLLVSCSPSPDPSESPVPSASFSATATPAATASVTPSPDSTPAVPTLLGDDLTFGFSDFAGAPVGSTRSEFSRATGLVGTTCKPGMVNYFPPETDAEDWIWLLWASSRMNEADRNDSDGGSADPTEDWKIDFFSLQPSWGVDASKPFGPTGPGGIRLGSTGDDVLAAFPGIRGVERSEVDLRFSDVPMTSLDYIHNAPDGTSIVFVVRDGHVISIYWGSADLADGPIFAGCD